MVNIFLIILLIAIPVITCFCSFLFIVLFSSPVDRFQAPIPKFVVLFAMTFAICAIFVLPFDVWNATQGGQLEAALPIIWQILFAVIIVMVLVVIPFTFFYYESWDPEITYIKGVLYQAMWGAVSCGVLCVIVGAVIGLSYIGLKDAEIPVVLYTSATSADSYANAIKDTALDCDTCFYKGDTLVIQMSFIVYATGIMSIGGWLAFVICGGCGMSTLPLNCLFMWCKKPPKITKEEFEAQQKLYAQRIDKLLELGFKINDMRKNRVERLKPKSLSTFREFKAAVNDLEEDWKFLYDAYAEAGGSFFLYIGATIAGIFFSILTILWIVHIIIYMIPPFPLWGFLNMFMIWLDQYVFPIFGLLFYGVFAMYLVMCVIYGNIAVASRLPLVTVFPLKWKDTMINSFLFNAGLLLLVSITIIQFCMNAFSMYARFTTIDSYFNMYIGYMRGLGYFFRYVHYVLFVFILIGVVASIINACIPTAKQKRLNALMANVSA